MSFAIVKFVVAFFLFIPSSIVHAETKTFIKEYTYQASEDDSRNSSRTISLREVKRLLLEELGTYLESVTEVQNFQLTKDQITTLTAGIVRTEIVEEKWNGKTYWLKSKIQADSNEVIKSIDILRQDRQNMKELEEVRKRSDALLRENTILRKELASTKGEIREGKVKDYNQNIKELTASEWWEKGYAFLISKNYNDAIDSFNRSIELKPNIAGGYSYRGAAYSLIGNFNQAIKDYDSAIGLDSKYAMTYWFRGFLHGELGNYNQSLKDFDKAIELNPNDTRSYNGRSMLHQHLGNYNQALKDSDKAIELNPQYAEAYSNRGYAYLSIQNYSKAINDFDKSIELDPKYTGAYVNRGAAYTKIGNYKQSIKDYDKAIDLDPKSGIAYFNRALSYGRLMDESQMIENLKIAARLGYKDAQNLLKENGISW